MKNTIVTVDFESDWGGRAESIHAIDKMTGPVLDALDEAQAKATFFVSTEIAEAAKPWLKKIAAAGHELASHGHHHKPHYDQLSKDELREQLKRSKGILEDIGGEAVSGFRTPQFRKNAHTEEVLTELGYLYDSSSVLIDLPGRYRRSQYQNKSLPEFPVAQIHSRFPAGVKWINLMGFGRPPKEAPSVVYVHLFDLMRMRETLQLASSDIDLRVLMFYMARRGSTFRTLQGLLHGSTTLRSLLPN